MISFQIDQQRLLDRFSALVSMDSPSFGERAVADFLIESYRTLGIALTEDICAEQTGGNCGNLHVIVDGGLDLPPLLFCAHMDTVEPSRNKKAVFHEDGTITSDGTTVLGADDAAALAVLLEAVQVLKECEIPHRPIELLFTTAEEPYCVGIAAMDFDRLQSKQAYVFDLSGPIGGAAVQAPTILSFTAKMEGKASHAGFAPERGIHAIQASASAISRIRSGRIGDVTVNIGTVSGGIQNNIVPDQCTFTGEIRSYSDVHAIEQFDRIKNITEKTAAEFGASAEVSCKRHTTAYHISTQDAVAQRYQRACASLGVLCDFVSTFGGSDNNHLAAHGIHGIVPATAMHRVHTCEEYTTVTELVQTAKLALLLMTDKEA